MGDRRGSGRQRIPEYSRPRETSQTSGMFLLSSVSVMASSSALPLSDKIILITGASSGIGASIAKHVVEAGATAVLSGRREDRLTQEVEAISALIKESMFLELVSDLPFLFLRSSLVV